VLSKAWIPAFAGTTFIWLALLLSINGHAADGLPDLTTADGGRYYGSLRDGKPNGRGRVEWDNGALYEGNFQNGVYEGRGRFVGPDGRRYEGEFANGLFDGRGRLESPNGELYEGDFEKGEFTGYGTWSRPDGARYRGAFLKGRMHGEGRYSDGQGEVYEGEFVDGVFKPLIAQRKLLEAQLAGIERGRPGTIELYLLAVGGDGTQEVFRREVEFVQQAFDQRFGTRGRSLGLANGKSTSLPMASVATIGEALGTLAERMDRDEDILFLFLTSHGTPTHELKLQQPGFALRDLPAPELGRMLRRSGIRWKVVVVSACYSGGFIDSLRDDNTLVITASRYDRSSFGCTDDAQMTYFGRAFFKEALPKSRSFQEAFAKADELVAEWERKDQPKEPRSLPQLRSAAPIEAQLERWAAQK
jgi:hypothetical protein